MVSLRPGLVPAREPAVVTSPQGRLSSPPHQSPGQDRKFSNSLSSLVKRLFFFLPSPEVSKLWFPGQFDMPTGFLNKVLLELIGSHIACGGFHARYR